MNAAKSEALLEINGKVYTLAASSNAIAAVENLFSTLDRRVTFQEIIRQANRGSFTHVRALLWSMLRKHHRELSPDDVGDLIDASGGLPVFEQKMKELLTAMVPNPADLKALGIDTANPQTAQETRPKAGTGVRSIRRHAKSA